MNLQDVISAPTLPGNITPDSLQILQEDSLARASLLQQIIHSFEKKYGCSLETFEEWLAHRQVPEHPHWEESIEWRNAVEELERTRISRSIFTWLDSLLTQSAVS